MHYSHCGLLFIFALTAFGAPLKVRDNYTTLMADWKQIEIRDEPYLTAKITPEFDGTATKWNLVVGGYNTVTADVKKSTSDWQATQSLTSNQCSGIIGGRGQNIEYRIQDTVNAYIQRKPDFKAAGYLSQCISQMKSLQADYNTMWNAACSKCPATAQCSTVRTASFNDWQKGIDFFNQP